VPENDDDPTVELGELFQDRRQRQILEVRDLRDDPPHHDRIAFAAVEDVRAEAGQPLKGIRHVDRALMIQIVPLFLWLLLPLDDLLDDRGHRFIAERRHIEEARAAIDADHRHAAGLKVDIGPVDLDGGLQEVVERQPALPSGRGRPGGGGGRRGSGVRGSRTMSNRSGSGRFNRHRLGTSGGTLNKRGRGGCGIYLNNKQFSPLRTKRQRDC
jgi:hypothetical protein